jgi:hypothetical protein
MNHTGSVEKVADLIQHTTDGKAKTVTVQQDTMERMNIFSECFHQHHFQNTAKKVF